ncbi:MAG: hypothetical protein HY308_01005 [Gammaproteobacteria bacterium]|nr:hypothetical protein [Gammaproteobacteria bacterium]
MMNAKTVTALSVLFALACASCTSTSPPTAPTACNFSVPLPPDPLPAGFSWQPLAQQWCSQLAACGYATQGCVQEYLAEINSGPTTAAATTPGTGTQLSIDRGQCEDSVEAQTNPAICNAKRIQTQQGLQ